MCTRFKSSTLRSNASRLASRGCVKHRASTLTRSERLALVERGNGELTLTDQADLLSLGRRSYQPVAPSAKKVAIKHAIDITYIPLVAGWMYLVAGLDVYTCSVVSWALDDTLEMPFVLDAVRRA